MRELSMRAVDLTPPVEQRDDRVALVGEQPVHGTRAGAVVFEAAGLAALIPAPRPTLGQLRRATSPARKPSSSAPPTSPHAPATLPDEHCTPPAPAAPRLARWRALAMSRSPNADVAPSCSARNASGNRVGTPLPAVALDGSAHVHPAGVRRAENVADVVGAHFALCGFRTTTGVIRSRCWRDNGRCGDGCQCNGCDCDGRGDAWLEHDGSRLWLVGVDAVCASAPAASSGVNPTIVRELPAQFQCSHSSASGPRAAAANSH